MPVHPHPIRHAATRALLALGLLLVPRLSLADEPCEDYLTPETRRDLATLTMRGTACFDQRRYGQALRFYREAFTQERTPLLEAAIGRTMHELGLWSTARAYYKRYLGSELARRDPDSRQRILDRLVSLQNDLRDKGATLTLTAAPTRTYVYLELPNHHRESLGATPMTLRLGPGQYTLIFEKRGYYPHTATLRLEPNAKQLVEAELVPQSATFNLPARSLRRVGTITIASALPVAVAGGVLAAVGYSNISEAQTLIQGRREDQILQADRDMLARGTSQRAWGHGLLIIGSAALLTGAVLTYVAHTQDGPPAPAPTPKGSGRPPSAPRSDAARWETLQWGLSPWGAAVQWRW